MPEKFSAEPKGLVVCYIGAGKGKTTAAMGLAARAAGAGMNVYILQFVKAIPQLVKNGSDFAKASSDGQSQERIARGEWPVSNEINFFENISSSSGIGKIETEQAGLGFVGILGDRKERDEHTRQALKGLGRAREIILSGDYQLVVLDEIISALELKLIEERDIVELIELKLPETHLVLTGHNKFPKILSLCDLVTEMKMIKHPYYKGVLAQRGIDY